jgi:hypothetical protein
MSIPLAGHAWASIIFNCTLFHNKQRELLIKQNKQQSNEKTMKIHRFKVWGPHSSDNLFCGSMTLCSEDGNGLFFKNMFNCLGDDMIPIPTDNSWCSVEIIS